MRCTAYGCAFECDYDKWAECPQHMGVWEFASPPGPLSHRDFVMACLRLDLENDPAAVKRLFGVSLADFDRWENHVYVSDEIARTVKCLLTAPPRRTVHNAMSAPKGPNTKFGVRTPEGVFPTVNAAAEFYTISVQTAYARATRGAMGWSKVTRQEIVGRDG